MSSGQFVGGKYVDQFEKKLQSFVMLNTVSLNSGTDALTVALCAS